MYKFSSGNAIWRELRSVWSIVLVSLLGGMLFGYCIGFVAVYTALEGISHECPLYKSEAVCPQTTISTYDGRFNNHQTKSDIFGENLRIPQETDTRKVSVSRCVWKGPTEGCRYYYEDTCLFIGSNEKHCNAVSTDALRCTFGVDSYTANAKGSITLTRHCRPTGEMPSILLGPFASAMTIGALLGSTCAHTIIRKFPYSTVGIASGMLFLLSCLAMHADPFNYPRLFITRCAQGYACGVLCVLCPMFVTDRVPSNLRHSAGVIFQVAITIGIAITAFLGILLDPRVLRDDNTYEVRSVMIGTQIFLLFGTLLSILFIIAFNRAPKFKTILKEDSDVFALESVDDGNMSSALRGSESIPFPKSSLYQDTGLDKHRFITHTDTDSERIPYRSIFIAVIICTAQQLTGINAIINYAPRMLEGLGLKPLTGNFVVMLWNFMFSLLVVAWTSKYQLHRLYLWCTLGASLSCIVTGLTFLFTESTVLSLIGIGTFISFFAVGMGPSFFILIQEVFPSYYRSKGNSMGNSFQFFLNILVNMYYPSAVDFFSYWGSSISYSSPARIGPGMVFVIFGVIGMVCWVTLFKLLRLYRS